MSEKTATVSLALSSVLGGNAGLEVFDYSRTEDFRRLWSNDRIEAKRVLIVWPQTAPDSGTQPG